MAKIAQALMTAFSVRTRKTIAHYRWYWYRHI